MPSNSSNQLQSWLIPPIGTDWIDLGLVVRLAARRCALIVLVMLLAAGVVEASPSAVKPHVLLLNSYHAGMDWTDGETAGVREVLQSAGPDVLLHIEYMDTKRLADDVHFENLRRLLAHKYRNIRLSAIIATDNDAFNFLQRYRDDLFGAVPVIFTGVNFFDERMLDRVTGYTGVAETFEGGQTIAMMHRLHPQVRRIVVIVDATTTGKAIRRELEPMLAPFAGQLTFEFWDDLSLTQLRERLPQLDANALVLLMPYARDSEDTYISYADMARLVSGSTRVPVYGTWDFYMGYGIVGGRLTNAAAQGRAAAQLLLRVLGGAAIERIPVTRVAPSEFQFDARELQRHGIAKSELPPGSRLLFLSWYETHRVLVWLSAGLGLISLLLGWAWGHSLLLRRRSERARLESDARYHLILRHSPTGILHYNSDLIITYCNARLAEILHTTCERLNGLDMKTLRDQRVLPALQAALQGEDATYEGEYTATLSDHELWVSMTCAPFLGPGNQREGGVAIVEDISARHAARLALEQSEANYRELVEHVNAIILRVGLDGTVTYFNDVAERFFGYTSAEILGKHVIGTIVPAQESSSGRDLSALIDAILADPARYEDNENENITRDGRSVYVRWANQVIRDASGKPTGMLSIGRDVTALKRNQDALQESEERFRTIANYTYDWEYWEDARRKMLFISPSCERITGYQDTEFIHDPALLQYIVHPEDRDKWQDHVCSIQQAPYGELSFRIVRKDGQIRWIAHGCQAVFSRNGEFRGRRSSNRDITELKQAEHLAHHLAYYDSLTNLPNRRMLTDRMRSALLQARRFHRSLAVMFLDLDRFKLTNDSLGHDIGDKLLVGVAGRLADCVRQGDTVARTGGDEFIILLPEIAQPNDACTVAEKIIQAVSAPFRIDDHIIDTSASIGIAIYPIDGADDIEALMKKADLAMYEAKQEGRNCYSVFDSE